MSVSSNETSIITEQNSPYSNSIHLSLRQKATSGVAIGVVTRIATDISARDKPLRKHVEIVGAVIGDLLKGLSMSPSRSCYRAMSCQSFTGFRYGYKPFTAVRDALVEGEYLLFVRGRQPFDDIPGVASRFHATEKLLSDLSAAGISPANFTEHFSIRTEMPLVHDPIRLKTASTRVYGPKVNGKPMTFERTPTVVQLEDEIHRINEFLRQQRFEGMTFDGLFRGFNEGDREGFAWNRGGRLYAVGGGFQGLDKRTERPLIRINGEQAVEVDIRASHLTIFHALMKTPLPGSGDPYETGEIGRDGIKLFCAITLGSGKVPRRWSSDACDDYGKGFLKLPIPGMTGNLQKDYPFPQVRDIALQHIPLLKSVESSGYTWADFQFIESQILIESIKNLMKEGIPTLPIHDSLISRESDSDKTSKNLTNNFKVKLGVECYTKVK